MLVSPNWEHVGVAFGLFGLELVGSVCMLVQAYRIVPKPVDRNVSRPWIAAFLSAVLPGLGQFYNHQFVLGLLLIGGAVAMFFLRGFVWSIGGNLLEVERYSKRIDVGERGRG